MGDPLDLECFSDPNLERVAWYCFNADDLTRPVMGLEPNSWGLYDVLGNASEWVNDESDGAPAISEVDPDGRVRLRTSRNRRGGRFSTWSRACRAASQLEGNWNFRQPGIGFRLARTLPEP
jgi:formylglycine-generating enzyme required for sulfatase activity